MALEDLVGPNKFITALVRTNPEGSDAKSQGDDHLRGVKNVVLNSLPNFDQALQATPAQIDALVTNPPGVPIGGGCWWFAETVPDGFLEANGQAVSRSTYAALFALWGEKYGSGDGSTTFNIPNLAGRALQARGQAQDTGPDDGEGQPTPGTLRALDDTFGREVHKLAESEMPVHQHPAPSNLTGPGSGSFIPATSSGPVDQRTFQTQSAGGDQPHTIEAPRFAALFIIRGL